ncbi:RNA 2',3'-cyclic phosphodiesterase [Bacteriovorax sp. Seq25_V]|uniref:RNA 2',3'-cyclic phosphodiesterase n=1 Tax=Bacteriovorax sp. Seq25_V TaxID=1201288 RepID=UPI00038A4F35|nr:RNA 2',3'-cyclic phosphodiesterase [Bacteriovorax sp. Seq25_V]EQC45648.1 2'-5' RNA ligase [Bacteriovorax sp. Seq25_V]
MKRLFLAIEIPEDIRDDLLDLRINTFNVNWTPFENMHLTLQFLGDSFNDNDVESICSKLSRVRNSAFDLTLSSVGYFGSENNPRVLYCGVEKEQTLLDLQKQIVDSLRSFEFDMEVRKYIPHVTLGRPKKLPYEEVARFLQSFSIFRSEVFHVDKYLLMESILTRHGPVYNVLEEFELYEMDGL